MITGRHIANTAIDSGLLGTPYSQMDCQAFVEVILKRAGLHIINYRGSNQMWRELVHDRQEITGNGENVPAGALAFIVRDDGGEVKRGYHDSMKNATHVAIALGDGRVMESTTGGVQYSKIKRFTNYGLINDVDYIGEGGTDNAGEGSAYLDVIRNYLSVIRDNLNDLEAYVNDLYRGT